jgi:hypothetical protein
MPDTNNYDKDTAPNNTVIDITDNYIHFPFEWNMKLNLGVGYLQISLVDDRISIHKPTAADVQYTKPCKAGDNSYIRSAGLLGVHVPKKFLEALGIAAGGNAELTLEENCISIRKRPDEPEAVKPEPPEPIMAFCCVCGRLMYTGEGLIKVLSKYICHECVETVKALKITEQPEHP